MGDTRSNDSLRHSYRELRIKHWDKVAVAYDSQVNGGRYYHQRISRIYQFLIPPGQRVLEIGCGQGELLAALKTSKGVGIDFSAEMLKQARQKHPQLQFIEADAHDFNLGETFDVIILSDLVNDLWDAQEALVRIRRCATAQTRIIINYYSRVWEKPLLLAQRFKIARPLLAQNWLTTEDLSNLFYLADFQVIRHWQEVLWPFSIPVLSGLCNRYLVKLWPFNLFALTNFIVCRPKFSPKTENQKPTVSVVVSVRNEAGNIKETLERMPEMGGGTEIIFVEGHSTDDTYAAIEKTIAENPQRNCRLLRQRGVGKADAVRLGFFQARGEVFMIHDGDLTVAPEDLSRCYEILSCGKAEFVNGVRFVYPRQEHAMRFCNLIGNKFFSMAFSWLLGQHIKDTLCATKALSRENYARITANRAYFGDFDPFGDFDLLFGAAKLNLKIVDLPVRYRQRSYGTTKISRWRHGWMLLKMLVFAARKLKFV